GQSKAQNFNLIVNWYVDNDRYGELRECLRANVLSRLFTSIIVVGTQDPNIPGVNFVRGQDRATFTELLRVANTNTKADDINVIANLDIVFNRTLLLAKDIGEWEMYALS